MNATDLQQNGEPDNTTAILSTEIQKSHNAPKSHSPPWALDTSPRPTAVENSTPYVSMEYGLSQNRAEEAWDQSTMQTHRREDDENRREEDRNYFGGPKHVTSAVVEGVIDPVGFYIVCLNCFVGDMARGIFFPTMWQLVQHIGGDEVVLGYSVASFSFGRMLVSPVFGSWTVKYGYRWTLLLSCYMFALSTLLFAQVSYVGRPYFLILANGIMGGSSATLGMTLAYTSDVTPNQYRTKYISMVTAIQYSGTAVTPFIGSLFVKLLASDNGATNVGFFALNEFTAPTYFMTFATLVNLYLVKRFFVDRPRGEKAQGKPSAQRQASDEVANSPICFGFLTIYDACILCGFALHVFVKGPMACYETLGISFAESHFHMYRAKAGAIVATMGSIGALNLLFMGILSRHFDDIQLTNGGNFIFMVAILTDTTLDKQNENPHWRYVVSMFLSYGVGYPIGQAALMSLFSKIVGRRPQGTIQGWFAAAGSFARVSFPIISGYIVSRRDIETLFFFLGSILGLSIAFAVSFGEMFRALTID